MSKLVRNLKTEVVHRPECPSRGANAAPWHYATGLTLQQVSADTALHPWLHLCRKCLPAVCCCGKCADA